MGGRKTDMSNHIEVHFSLDAWHCCRMRRDCKCISIWYHYSVAMVTRPWLSRALPYLNMFTRPIEGLVLLNRADRWDIDKSVFKYVNGGCSSMVEPRIVIPVVVGSSPISHPKYF